MGRTAQLEAKCQTGKLKFCNCTKYVCKIHGVSDYLVIPGAQSKTNAQSADTTPTDGITRFCGGVFGATTSTSTVSAHGTLCSKCNPKAKR